MMELFIIGLLLGKFLGESTTFIIHKQLKKDVSDT